MDPQFMSLVWFPNTVDPDISEGVGIGGDEFLTCWWDDDDEEWRVEINRWLGGMWKYRTPSFWAAIPVPESLV